MHKLDCRVHSGGFLSVRLKEKVKFEKISLSWESNWCWQIRKVARKRTSHNWNKGKSNACLLQLYSLYIIKLISQGMEMGEQRECLHHGSWCRSKVVFRLG